MSAMFYVIYDGKYSLLFYNFLNTKYEICINFNDLVRNTIFLSLDNISIDSKFTAFQQTCNTLTVSQSFF